MNTKLLIICLFAITIGTVAYGAQTVNDRLEIDDDSGGIAAAINADDFFGYQIEAIGDLDSDGDVDLFDYNKFQLEYSGPK